MMPHAPIFPAARPALANSGVRVFLDFSTSDTARQTPASLYFTFSACGPSPNSFPAFDFRSQVVCNAGANRFVFLLHLHGKPVFESGQTSRPGSEMGDFPSSGECLPDSFPLFGRHQTFPISTSGLKEKPGPVGRLRMGT